MKICKNCKKGRLFKRCDGLQPISYCTDFIKNTKGMHCLDFAIIQRGYPIDERGCEHFIKKEKNGKNDSNSND